MHSPVPAVAHGDAVGGVGIVVPWDHEHRQSRGGQAASHVRVLARQIHAEAEITGVQHEEGIEELELFPDLQPAALGEVHQPTARMKGAVGLATGKVAGWIPQLLVREHGETILRLGSVDTNRRGLVIVQTGPVLQPQVVGIGRQIDGNSQGQPHQSRRGRVRREPQDRERALPLGRAHQLELGLDRHQIGLAVDSQQHRERLPGAHERRHAEHGVGDLPHRGKHGAGLG